ncbi:olfactory receptor 1E5-like [Rana temporaria]|uniref:olfactory receptor 1E5-like n=1 Tax=Rana temporaria TaxID=8407 RepID=UPI001AACB7E8|nr:olfactory receptor 1E5-like [Rana temporaria]
MEECLNNTENVFYISAFAISKTGQCLLFIAVLLIYLMTLLGNMTIAVLVCWVSQLHTPMYFFLSNLAISDVLHVSVTLPKLLSILLTQDHWISFSACMTQVYFFSLSVGCDIFILTAMAYDRYVAICKPLQYSLLMSKDVCISLALSTWLISLTNSIINVLSTSLLSYCLTQNVDHFICNMKDLYAITSSDATSRNTLLLCQDVLLAVFPFLLIMTSYIFIFSTILKIRSSEGRLKAYSSCTSHLTTVILFYVPIIIIYGKPGSESSNELDKLLTLLYTAVVPMLNPFVYTLRNQDVLNAIQNIKRKRNLIFLK